MLNFDLWHYDSDLFKFPNSDKRNDFMNKTVKKYLTLGYDYVIIEQSQIENICPEKYSELNLSISNHNYKHYFFSYSGFNKL